MPSVLHKQAIRSLASRYQSLEDALYKALGDIPANLPASEVQSPVLDERNHAAGKHMWEAQLGSAVYSPITPVFLSDAQQHILIGTDSGQLHCLDAASGAECWRQHVGDKGNAQQTSTGISTAAAPRLAADILWDQFHRNTQKDGTKAVLSLDEHAEQPHASKLSVLECQAWSCTNDGNLLLGSIEADRYSMMAEAQLNNEVFSSPVAFDQVVVFGCRDEHLYCVELH